MTRLRLGTRRSALAQTQARFVAGELQRLHPGLSVNLVLMLTSGDRQTENAAPSTPTPTSGGLKALFTKEIEDALLENRIDLAVHSLKDLAADLPEGLCIGAIPLRADPRDVWISKAGKPFGQISPGTRIGTNAVRRQAQLRRLIPQAVVVPLRGNVDTRLRKLADSDLDGIVLASAGLVRLGLADRGTEILSPDLMLPAVGQGSLAVQIRTADVLTRKCIASLHHLPSEQAAQAERAFMRGMGGSCQTPLAAYAQVNDGTLTLQALALHPTEDREWRTRGVGPAENAEAIGLQAARDLLSAGAVLI